MRKIRRQQLKDPSDFLAQIDDRQQTVRVENSKNRGSVAYKNVKNKEKSESKSSPPSKLKIVIAIGFLLLLSLGAFVQVFNPLVSLLSNKFVKIHVDNAERLKEVFFGGEPWLIACSDQNATSSATELIRKKSSSIESFVRLGYLPCDATLPSGKTIRQRFGLSPYSIGFLVANNNKPKPLSLSDVKNEKVLSEFVEKHTALKALGLRSNQEYQKWCRRPKAACVLIMTPTPLGRVITHEYLPLHMQNARRVKVFHMDTSHYQAQFDPLMKLEFAKHFGLPKTFLDEGELRVFCSVNISKDKQRKSYLGALYKGDFHDGSSLGSFLRDCQGATEENVSFKSFSKLPTIKNASRVIGEKDSVNTKTSKEHRTAGRKDDNPYSATQETNGDELQSQSDYEEISL